MLLFILALENREKIFISYILLNVQIHNLKLHNRIDYKIYSNFIIIMLIKFYSKCVIRNSYYRYEITFLIQNLEKFDKFVFFFSIHWTTYNFDFHCILITTLFYLQFLFVLLSIVRHAVAMNVNSWFKDVIHQMDNKNKRQKQS